MPARARTQGPAHAHSRYLILFLFEICHLFLEILRMFTGIFLRFSDPNIHFRSEVRSYPKNVPTVFFKNRSFGGVEPPKGLEIVPDILTQNFLEIRILTATGAGSD
jgi:hypothetical protein